MKLDVPVIIITAFGTLTNAHEAIRYGAVDFISKPYNATDILSIVRRTVERKQLYSQMKSLETIQGLENVKENRPQSENFMGN